jgi:hypothetical protein
MTKDEALKMALEALHGFIPYLPLNDEAQCGRYDEALTAIKEALAQPEITTGNILMDSYKAMQSMKVEGPRHVVCQCDKCKAPPEQEPVSFAKIFTQLKTDDEPCNEVIALGHMMRDWLQKQVSDNSSYVDTGKGFSEYNLWVMCEGKELLISIKESK